MGNRGHQTYVCPGCQETGMNEQLEHFMIYCCWLESMEHSGIITPQEAEQKYLTKLMELKNEQAFAA